MSSDRTLAAEAALALIRTLERSTGRPPETLVRSSLFRNGDETVNWACGTGRIAP